MKEYGHQEEEIEALNQQLEDLNQKLLQFHEFKKAKDQYKA